MMTANNTKAGSWGANIDMATLPTWSHQHVAENVLFTRNFLAANPAVMQSNGFIDLSQAGTTPLMIPQDISAALGNAGSSTTTPSAPMSTGASMSMSTSAHAPTSSGMSSGAHSLTAPRIFVALTVAVATWFAL
jgi:urease alpha subunit